MTTSPPIPFEVGWDVVASMPAPGPLIVTGPVTFNWIDPPGAALSVVTEIRAAPVMERSEASMRTSPPAPPAPGAPRVRVAEAILAGSERGTLSPTIRASPAPADEDAGAPASGAGEGPGDALIAAAPW